MADFDNTIKRLFEINERQLALFPDKKDALAGKQNGQWKSYSTRDYADNVNWISYGLKELGLQKGDKIATVSNNRPEWNFLDLGMSQIGVIHVPIYTTISDEDFDYILNHAEPKLLIVSDKSLYDRLSKFKETVSTIEEVYSIDEVDSAPNWNSIIQKGKETTEKWHTVVNRERNEISEEEIATIIYTSGTTGNPKGVMLSHKNICSNLKSIKQVFHFGVSDVILSFLPISHIYERTINYYFQHDGLSIYYAENMGALSQNLNEVKPTAFIAVPRVLELVYDKILGKGKDLKGIKKQIFFWAVNLGLLYKLDGNSAVYNLKLRLASKLVFSKWRAAIGGRVTTIIVGGAALQSRLVKVFNAAGIQVGEGYGMTETSPVIATNCPGKGNNMPGTVGKVMPGLEVKIADDGEILTRSDCVMKGYYKEPELTKEVIDDEGWMHTGDIGELVEGKFIKITDRKKEIFKLSSGKYIAPQLIENKMKESFFIEQAMVIGENQKFASALISPNFQFLHNWCTRHKVKYRDNKELIQNQTVIKRYQREINEINEQFGQVEQIKRFRLVFEEWSATTRELSPTLKLRRKYLKEKYGTTITDIYSVEKEI